MIRPLSQRRTAFSQPWPPAWPPVPPANHFGRCVADTPEGELRLRKEGVQGKDHSTDRATGARRMPRRGAIRPKRDGRSGCVRLTHDMSHSRTDDLTRTNVTLPSSLLAAVDRMAGPRGRSRYVAEAVAQRVRRDALGAAIRETAGAMVGRPGWMGPDEVAHWVDGLRSEETD